MDFEMTLITEEDRVPMRAPSVNVVANQVTQ